MLSKVKAAPFLLLLSLSHVHGHAFEPRATPVDPGEKALVQNTSPVITTAPGFGEVKAASSVTQYPNTCGFVDGNFNEQVTCIRNAKCAIVSNLIGCCNAQTCGGFYTTCYDMTAIGTACTTCTVSEAQYCSNSYGAWCGTYYYPGSITDFQCSNAPATYTMVFNATTTYAPQNHAKPVPGGATTTSSSSSGSSSGSSGDIFSSGLVTWQIAVIAAGGFLALVGLLTCCYFWRRCMCGRRRVPPPAPPPMAYGAGYPQSPPQGYYQQQTVYPNK